jgi:hypothetical protein
MLVPVVPVVHSVQASLERDERGKGALAKETGGNGDHREMRREAR